MGHGPVSTPLGRKAAIGTWHVLASSLFSACVFFSQTHWDYECGGLVRHGDFFHGRLRGRRSLRRNAKNPSLSHSGAAAQVCLIVISL